MPAGSRAEAAIPQPIATNLVTASRRQWNGRDCLALELTDDEQAGRLNKTRSGNGPSFAIVHRDFTDGVIRSRHRRRADRQGRTGRPRLCRPVVPHRPGLRDPRDGVPAHDQRAPERAAASCRRVSIGPSSTWPIRISISTCRARRFPAATKEAPTSPSAAGRRLRLEVQGTHLRALVDGAEVLTVDDLHYAGRRGPVGLFVGDGSRGFFTNLSILAA